MIKQLLSAALFCFLPVGAQAGVILGTDTPLSISAGTTSGPMLVTIAGDGSSIMTAWQFSLVILPNVGATGTLTFEDPSSGFPINPPSNYIFGSNGVGISATNSGSVLSANDFNTNPAGTQVTSANLLQMDFFVTSGASGSFGIYAQGVADPTFASTSWTDDTGTQQFFDNTPDINDNSLIGTVDVTASTPEPATITLFGLGMAGIAGYTWRRRTGRVQLV